MEKQQPGIVTYSEERARMSVMPSMEEWAHLKDMAKVLCADAGELLPKALNTPGKILAIALIARDLQIPLMQALSSIYLVEGKPTMSAEQMRGLILERCQGAIIQIKRNDSKGCEIIASRPGQKATTFSFTEEDARNAGLLNKDNWKKYAADMYLARATARMGRGMFPDIIRGASYVHGELEDAIDVTPKGDKANDIIEAVKASKSEPAEVAAAHAYVEPDTQKKDEPSEADLALPKELKTKEEYIKEIGELGNKLGITPKQMNADIETEFKKKPKDLTAEEMGEFVAILQHKALGK